MSCWVWVPLATWAAVQLPLGVAVGRHLRRRGSR
jgi:hypothetical protein